MRRLAVVGAPAGAGREVGRLDDLRGWVGSLPSAGVHWLDRLADAPLERVDVLWLRDAVEPEPRLLAWLHAGGRLLATQAAVRLVSPLGLESHPPTDIPLPDPFPADFGLAGFGAASVAGGASRWRRAAPSGR